MEGNNFKNINNKIILISGSSGSGKGTLISKYVENHPEIHLSVSATTREKREHEEHGKDYHFISEEEFKKKIEEKDFFEWAFNHRSFCYGTPVSPILEALQSNKNVMMEINYEGFLKVKEIIPEENLVSIFILPPQDEEILKERIRNRAHISDEEIDHRINYSLKKEIEVSPQYKHQFEPTDGEIEKTYEEFKDLVNSYL